MNVNTEQQNQNYNINNTASTGISPLLSGFLNRYVVERVKDKLVFNQKGVGQIIKIPKGKTKTIHFTKMEPLPTDLTKLTEGVTPVGDSLDISDITATPDQYGRFVGITDEVDFYKYDPSPKVLDIQGAQAEQAAVIYDKLTLNELATCTNVQVAGGKTLSTVEATDVITVDEVRRAVRTLKKNKALPVSGNDYVCFLSPDMTYDLQGDEKWQKVKDYDPKDMYNGEIGRLFGVRFVESTQDMRLRDEEMEDGFAKGAGGQDLHCCYFCGKNAYGSTDTKGNVETVIQPPVDPLHQVSTLGWKGHHVAKIISDSLMVKFVGSVSI